MEMKILVFDDNQTHREAAKAQLKEHDLTVVGTYDEAKAELLPKTNDDRAEAEFLPGLLETSGLGQGFEPWMKGVDDEYVNTDEQRDLYWKLLNDARKMATTYPDFDVVLTDLLVPASSQAQGGIGLQFVGKEMPVGIFIGLLAAVRGRAKYVAVFTESNHHHNPASACFDTFNASSSPAPFTVEESKFMLCNTEVWIATFDPNDMSNRVDLFEDCPYDMSPNSWKKKKIEEGKVVITKDWLSLLNHLTKE